MTHASAAAEKHGFAGEAWGGLAAMLVALPSSIAFGVLVFSAVSPDLASQGALAGMVGAGILGLVAPLFDRTPALITAPCAPAAAVLSGLAVTLVHQGVASAHILALLGLTALLSALLQIVYGALHCGRLIKYIPYPVVSGFMSGVGLIIALGQIPPLLGLPAGTGLWRGLASPALWQVHGIVTGLVTMVVMILAPYATKKVPAVILGLAAGGLTYFVQGAWVPGLLTLAGNTQVIGHLPPASSLWGEARGHLASLAALRFEDLKMVAYAALSLSILLSIDTLKTCVMLDATSHMRHDSNRALRGQGIANLASFALGGLPGSGASGPTMINLASGGRGTASSLAEGVFVLLTLALLAPLVAWVPTGALAGILLVVSWRMFDKQSLKLLRYRETQLDFFVIAAFVAVAVTAGLVAASATGVGLSILLFIRDQIRGSVIRRHAALRDMPSKTQRLEAETEILRAHGDQAAVYELQGNLFFGTTDNLFTEMAADLARCRWLLLDLRRVQSMDYTAAHLFEQMNDRLHARGGRLLFSGMPSALPSRQDLKAYMESVGLVRKAGAGIRVFTNKDDALEWMEDRVLAAAGHQHTEEGAPLDLAEIELLDGADAKTVAQLRACAEEHTLKAGARIFSQGDNGDELILVRRGIVDILLPLKGGKTHHLATVGRGGFFGEMAFLDNQRRSADAVARTDCTVYMVSRSAFDDGVAKAPELGLHLFASLARAEAMRLRVTDGELAAIEDH